MGLSPTAPVVDPARAAWCMDVAALLEGLGLIARHFELGEWSHHFQRDAELLRIRAAYDEDETDNHPD